MCNKKAVLRTAPFIIRVTICEQAPIVTLTTKATQRVAFLLRIALVIPAGFEPTTHSLEGCCSIQLSYGTIRINAILAKMLRKSNIFFSISANLWVIFIINGSNCE